MRHPVESLVRHHAGFGTLPTAKELDDLELDAKHRAQVKQACQDAQRLRRDGRQGEADRNALEASLTIIASLPREQRDPSYTHVDPLADIDDPDQLAAAVFPQTRNW